MRKLLLFILPAAIAVALGACGGQAPTTTGEAPTTSALTEVEPTLELTSETGATSEALATSDSTTGEAAPEATSDMLDGATAEATGAASGGLNDATSTTSTLEEATADATTGTGSTNPTSISGQPAPTDSAGGVTGESADVLAALRADGRFNTLVTAIEAAGLEETLQNSPQFTLFAPTDEAFAALPPDQLQALLADPQQLSDILLYHVADQELMATDVTQAQSIPTIQGEAITVTSSGSSVLLNNSAQVLSTDIQAGNGVVHVIDQVLVPAA